jgi:hypothetical protein
MNEQRRERAGDRLLPGLAAGSAAIALGSLLYLMAFCVPYDDDFSRACRTTSLGEAVIDTYLSWSGRWCAHAIEFALLPQADLVKVYPIFQFTLSLVFALCLYVLWTCLLGEGARSKAAALLAFMTMAVLWDGTPGVDQVQYWFTGFVENQLPVGLSVLVIAGLIRLEASPGPVFPSIVCTSGLALLALVATGLHELAGMALVVVLGSGLAATYVARRHFSKAWAAVLLVACVGLAVVVLAPGNAKRREKERSVIVAAGGRPVTDLTSRMEVARDAFGWQLKRIVPDWFLDPRLLAATVILLLDPRIRLLEGHGSPDCRRFLRWTALAIWPALVLGYVAGPCWVTGHTPPSRTVSGAYSLFVIGWIVNLALWTPWNSILGASLEDGRARMVWRGALLALAAALVLTGNARVALADILQGKPQLYRRAIAERERTIIRARDAGEQDVVVAPIPVRPRLFFPDDLVPMSKKDSYEFYRNMALAKYYNVRNIFLRSDAATHP